MTAIEWGAEIEVNGERPDWLRDEDRPVIWNAEKKRSDPAGDYDGYYWSEIEDIKLPADHPYYTATARGFTYWPGSDDNIGPTDWDGGSVLRRSGHVGRHDVTASHAWRIGTASRKDPHSGDVIGYRKRTESPSPTTSTTLDEILAHAPSPAQVETITLAAANHALSAQVGELLEENGRLASEGREARYAAIMWETACNAADHASASRAKHVEWLAGALDRMIEGCQRMRDRAERAEADR